jgi:tetratricopeptide (TPR) repeat protein
MSFRPWLLVALAAIATYAGTLRHALVWDDLLLRDSIAEAHGARGLAGVATQRFTLDPARPTGYYRPVVTLSLWLDGRTGGGSALAYHVTNVLLHAACSLLALLLLRALLGSDRAALAGALLFAVHPIHAESVAWVSGRTDLWAALGVFASGATWLRIERGTASRPTLERALGLAAFALACFAKEVALVLPAALLAGEAALGPREGFWRRQRSWLMSWAALLGGVLAVRATIGLPPGLLASGLAAGRAATDPAVVAGAVAKYLRLLVAPWPANAYYLPEHVRIGATDAALATLLVAGCVVAGLRLRARAGFWALVWTGVFLLPVAGFAPQDVVLAERFLYLPSLAVCAVAGLALAHVPARAHALATAAIVMGLGAATFVRARAWRGEATLFAHMVDTSPASAVARNNLARTLIDTRRFDEAREHLREAVRLDPAYAEAHSNLSLVQGETGALAEAAASGEAALRLRPELTAARVNLLITYRQLGRCADGVRVASEAPPRSLTNARLARQLQLTQAACALPAPAADPAALSGQGNAAAAAGRHDEAVRLYTQAIEAAPGDFKTRNNRARSLLALGRQDEAISDLREAVRLDPGYALARLNLGMVLAGRGRMAEAAKELEDVEKTSADPALRDAAVRALARIRAR